MKVLITGGAGFIGSHVVRRFVKKYPNYQVFNLDILSYAGNLENLFDVENAPNYHFIKADICDAESINELFELEKFDSVIHLAAESHVDRSISNPLAFVNTNVLGTVNLLNAAKSIWGETAKGKLFYHVSTDEVYGSLGKEGFFTETTSYDPQSPYSASKASSDHFVRAYGNTYNLPYVISNCSNNYGPNQFPEKLIPLCIHNILNKKELPIYGKGDNIRDWLYVEDHAEAIDVIFHSDAIGETFNIGGENEWSNLALVELLCDSMDQTLGQSTGTSRNLIRFVKDRKGHDMRYAIDSAKLMNKLNWRPRHQFESGIIKTINWYLNNQNWLSNVITGDYLKYYKSHYG